MHISGAIYTIQDLVNGKVIETHIHNLRPFNYDEERTDPVAVAQQNAQEFVVEEVLAHRGDRAKRSTLEFRIRWSGFGEESDTWEPYKNLMHAEHIRCGWGIRMRIFSLGDDRFLSGSNHLF